jgi:hypothetical protein
MQRKAFLARAAGAAAVIGAASALPAQARVDEASDRNMRFMTKILSAVIDDLNQDAHDYGGYRVKAIGNLQTAVANINAGLQYEETHSNG